MLSSRLSTEAVENWTSDKSISPWFAKNEAASRSTHLSDRRTHRCPYGFFWRNLAMRGRSPSACNAAFAGYAEPLNVLSLKG
jgi:hypothetical protein